MRAVQPAMKLLVALVLGVLLMLAAMKRIGYQRELEQKLKSLDAFLNTAQLPSDLELVAGDNEPAVVGKRDLPPPPSPLPQLPPPPPLPHRDNNGAGAGDAAGPNVVLPPPPPPPPVPRGEGGGGGGDTEGDEYAQHNTAGTPESNARLPAVGLKQDVVDRIVELGLRTPVLVFDFDESADAKAVRAKEKLDEFLGQGMPQPIARMRAALFERELANMKERAIGKYKRAWIRLKQDLKADEDRKAKGLREQMMKMQQEAVQKRVEQDARDRAEREEAKKKKAEDMAREQEEARIQAAELKVQMEKIRQETLDKQLRDAEARRERERQDKEAERKKRDDLAVQEREEKRQLIEQVQAMQRDMMERNKKLAREDRLREMAEDPAADPAAAPQTP